MANRPQGGGGSRKGKPNKLTATVRESILKAFDEVGGPAYLARQAESNPTAFMTLLGKVLPVQAEVTGKDGEKFMPDPDLSKLTDAQLRILASLKLATDGG